MDMIHLQAVIPEISSLSLIWARQSIILIWVNHKATVAFEGNRQKSILKIIAIVRWYFP